MPTIHNRSTTPATHEVMPAAGLNDVMAELALHGVAGDLTHLGTDPKRLARPC